MFQKDSLVQGIIAGLFMPLAVSAGLFLLFKGLDLLDIASTIGFRPLFRERTITLIGIVANVWVINRFNKKGFTGSMRGVVIATSAYVFLWVIVFWKTVF